MPDSRITEQVRGLVENIERVILGKRSAVELCVVGLLARGHVLIEDIPGIGKTTLAQALARSIDCLFHRIQFTSDMLPSDILGVSVLDPRTQEFEFRPGPIFAGIVLADEVNRTPPKTQSALLEAMSESQVSVDGVARALPRPFMVLATQNPIEYEGTYTLPESQLDRFMLRVEIGYPGEGDELKIMRRRDPRAPLNALTPVMSASEVVAIQNSVGDVRVEDSVARYMLSIIQATRTHDFVQLGASPRASFEFFVACQARALVAGRSFVTPDDAKELADPVLCHRIILRSRNGDPLSAARARRETMREILARVPIPE